MCFRAHAHKNNNKNFILEYFRCKDGKELKQEFGWRVSVLPIPTFHCILCRLQCWNAGMGNTDTLHPNSCFCSFSNPISKNKIFVTSMPYIWTNGSNNTAIHSEDTMSTQNRNSSEVHSICPLNPDS